MQALPSLSQAHFRTSAANPAFGSNNPYHPLEDALAQFFGPNMAHQLNEKPDTYARELIGSWFTGDPSKADGSPSLGLGTLERIWTKLKPEARASVRQELARVGQKLEVDA